MATLLGEVDTVLQQIEALLNQTSAAYVRTLSSVCLCVLFVSLCSIICNSVTCAHCCLGNGVVITTYPIVFPTRHTFIHVVVL